MGQALPYFINKERMQIALEGGKKYVELRHDHFMVKAVSVLGEELAPKFLGANEYTSGKGVVQTRDIYIFPKREATLMAMSYSPVISASV